MPNNSSNSNQGGNSGVNSGSQGGGKNSPNQTANQGDNNPEKPIAQERDNPGDRFEIEVGDDCNRTIHLSSIKVNLRGKFAVSNITARKGGGRQIGETLLNMPDIPGMRVRVNLAKQAYTIYDPLDANPVLLERINSISSTVPVLRGPKVKPVESIQAQEKDPDRFKTFVLQLVRLVADGMAVVTDGNLPSEEALESLPGRELFDPNSNSNTKPKYAKDYSKWAQEIDKALK